MDERPFVSRVINKLAHYEGGIVPNVEQESPADDVPPIDSPEVVAGGAAVKKKKKKKKTQKKASASSSAYMRRCRLENNWVRCIRCYALKLFCYIDNSARQTLIIIL